MHHATLNGLIQLGICLAQEPGRRVGVRIPAQVFDGGSEGGFYRSVTLLTHTFLA